jgi:hypothetical protein
MLPHIIPLPHRFLQPWIKLRKCTIQNHNNRYIHLIHAYFTNYIHAQYTQEHLSLQLIDLTHNQLIIITMYHVINIQTHYHRQIAWTKSKITEQYRIADDFFNKIRLPRVEPHPLSPATEFCSNDDDLCTTVPALVACSSEGRSESRGFCSADTGGRK